MRSLCNNSGRAEALGALCRVVCSKQCREAVLAPYLARFYAAVRRGLSPPNEMCAAAVVYNAHDIFRYVSLYIISRSKISLFLFLLKSTLKETYFYNMSYPVQILCPSRVSNERTCTLQT